MHIAPFPAVHHKPEPPEERQVDEGWIYPAQVVKKRRQHIILKPVAPCIGKPAIEIVDKYIAGKEAQRKQQEGRRPVGKMTAQEAPFVPYGKKFVRNIGKNFIKAQNLEKIDNIDKMLGEHGKKRRLYKEFTG